MKRKFINVPLKKRRKKSYFLPLLIILATSSALIFYILSATSLVTANKAISDFWRTSYDILVRPAGSRSAIETRYNLVEPNYLNNIKGSISFDQYDAIKKIPGVEVAAPVANLGSARTFAVSSLINKRDIEKVIPPDVPGVYVVGAQVDSNNGYGNTSVDSRVYVMVLPESRIEDYRVVSARLYVAQRYLGGDVEFLIPFAGIDPMQEAQLFKLDQSLISGLYLGKIQAAKGKFPVLVNARPYVSFTYLRTLEKVDLPVEDLSIEKIQALGGENYLDTLPSHEIGSYGPASSEEIYPNLIEKLQIKLGGILFNYPQNFRELRPVSYQEGSAVTDDPQELVLEAKAQPYTASNKLTASEVEFELQAIGVYDIDKIPKPNEINQVPIETYYPPGGTLLYDENRNPVEPKPVLPSVLGDSYFTSPPLMLTTLSAARKIAGDNCISAIRVRVAGIDSYSKESEQKIEAVATAIHEQTGLDVDIVVGSSPRPVLVHIPEVGYVEEMWIQKGVSTDYSEGLSLANKLMLGVFSFVSFLAVFEYSWMEAYNRRREFALSKALGWRTGSLVGYEVGKAALVSLGCALVSCLLALGAALIFKLEIPQPLIFLEAIGIVLGISMLGSLAPVWTASRAAPIEVIRDHADRKTVRLLPSISTLRIALNSLIRSPLETFLNLAEVALSMALLCYLIIAFDSQRGYLGGTLLGQYLVVKLQPSHFFLTLTGLLMAVAAIAIYSRNRVQLEHQEIAITNAVGWRRKDVRKVYLLQSGIIGLLGGAIGVGLALLINSALGGGLKFPSPIGWIVLAVGLLLPTLACTAISFLAIRRQIELKASANPTTFHKGRKS